MEKNKISFTEPIIVFTLAVICQLLWGSAIPTIKTGYRLFQIASESTGSQILFAGIRFTLAGILTVLMKSAADGRFLKPEKSAAGKILKVCLFQTVLQYIFFYIGVANLSGSKASILSAVNVFTALLISALIFRMEKLSANKVLGCIVGFSGVIIASLTGQTAAADTSVGLNGEIAMLLSAASYGFSSVLIKRYGRDHDPVMISGYQFITGGMALIILGSCMGGHIAPQSAAAVPVIFYLAFISAAAYSVWGILLKYNPVSKITVFSFLSPIVGVAISAIVLKDAGAFNLRCLTALALVCLGITLVNRPSAR